MRVQKTFQTVHPLLNFGIIIQCMHITCNLQLLVITKTESHIRKLLLLLLFFFYYCFQPAHEFLWNTSHVGHNNSQVWEKKTGSCGVTQVLSQNWRDATGSFEGPLRPGYVSLFEVFCIHNHEPSNRPWFPSHTLFCFVFLWVWPVYPTYSVWLYSKTSASVLNGQEGIPLIFSYCFYWLRQFKSTEWETWRENWAGGVRYCTGGS